MPPRPKAKNRTSRTSDEPCTPLLGATRRSKATGISRSGSSGTTGISRSGSSGTHLRAQNGSEQSTPLLEGSRGSAPSMGQETDVCANTLDTDPLLHTAETVPEASVHQTQQAPRKPKKKAHSKANAGGKRLSEKHVDEETPRIDGQNVPEIAEVRGSVFDSLLEDAPEKGVTSTKEHSDPSHRKVVHRRKVVRKPKQQHRESVVSQTEGLEQIEANTTLNQADKQLTQAVHTPNQNATQAEPKVSPVKLGRARPKPFLAGLSPHPGPRHSLGSEDCSFEDVQKAESKKKPRPKKVSTCKKTGAPSSRSTENRIPSVTFTFRFLNYNMANRTDANLDDVAAGFKELHRKRTQAVVNESTSFQSAAGKEASAGEESAMVPSMSQKLPVEQRNLAQLLMEGAKFESLFPQEKPVEQNEDTQRRPRVSTEFDNVLEEYLNEPKPKAKNRSSIKKRSSQNAEAKPQKKVLTFAVADAEEDESKEKGEGGMIATQSTKSSNADLKSMGSTTSMKSTRPGVKKKTFFRSFTLRRGNTRKSAFVPMSRSMNVDCTFGVLCESQFPLEELAEVLNDEVLNGECHISSASQMVNEKGTIEGMRGLAASTLCGDLKTITMCREEGGTKFEEVPGGKTITPCDDKGNNPMKSFLVRSFDIECDSVESPTASKALNAKQIRVCCLGSHFPMKKVASLMQDTEMPSDTVVQKTKYMMARLLKKALHHLLEEKLLTKNSIVILQGDLNSRCILHDGKFLDIMWETLEDFNLQQYISMGLPSELRGEWREVVQLESSGELPVTYRFDQTQSSIARGSNLQLREVYGEPEDGAKSYRGVMERIQANGVQKDWGLYNQKLDDDGNKFKPSRLPSCTERVLYYAPASFGDCCWWTSAQGYEVNYLQTGSDHKPVVLEATLNIGRRQESTRAMSIVNATACLVTDDIETKFEQLKNLEAEESGNSSESEAPEGRQSKRTAVRLSVDGDMTLD